MIFTGCPQEADDDDTVTQIVDVTKEVTVASGDDTLTVTATGGSLAAGLSVFVKTDDGTAVTITKAETPDGFTKAAGVSQGTDSIVVTFAAADSQATQVTSIAAISSKPASAAVADVTIDGTVGTALASGNTVTITLTNDTFTGVTAGADVASWFTNLYGLTAVTAGAPTSSDTVLAITVSGAPTTAGIGALAISIPAEKLTTSTTALAVTANPDAKFVIVTAGAASLLTTLASGAAVDETDPTGATVKLTGAKTLSAGTIPAGTTLSTGWYALTVSGTLTISGTIVTPGAGKVVVDSGTEAVLQAALAAAGAGKITTLELDDGITLDQATTTVPAGVTLTVLEGVEITVSAGKELILGADAELIVAGAYELGSSVTGTNDGTVTVTSTGEINNGTDVNITGTGTNVVEAGGKVYFSGETETPYIGDSESYATYQLDEGATFEFNNLGYTISGNVTIVTDSTSVSANQTLTIKQGGVLTFSSTTDNNGQIAVRGTLNLDGKIVADGDKSARIVVIVTNDGFTPSIVIGEHGINNFYGKTTETTDYEQPDSPIVSSSDSDHYYYYRSDTAGGEGVAGWKLTLITH